MYETAGDPETANNNLIRNANKTWGWYASNPLKGNLSKYQVITLKTASDIVLHFQGNTIESSDCLKLLGVTIKRIGKFLIIKIDIKIVKQPIGISKKPHGFED